MRTIAILWRSTHPVPTVTVTLIALGLGVSVGLEAVPLVLLVLAVFFGQVSIGLSNDSIDAARDREAGRRDKPLARPKAPRTAAWIVVLVASVAAIVLSLILGAGMAIAHLVFLCCAWAYNARLKSTIWSPACFMVGFGMFPSLAPLSLPEPVMAPLWASGVGALFGLAVHFSNVVPDLDDDQRTGVRGLPHRLGERTSLIIAFTAVMVGAAIVAIASSAEPGFNVVPWVGLVVIVAVAIGGLVLALRHRRSALSFRVVMVAAVLLVVQLMITGGLTG